MRTRIIILVVLVVLVLSAVFFLAKVSKIECQTEYGACPDYYLSRVNFLLGKSIFFGVSLDEINQALSSYVEIADVSVKKIGFGKLVLHIKFHEPFGIVNNYLVDDSGHVLSIATTSAYPKLKSDQQVLPGKKLDPSVINALQVLKKLSEVFPLTSDASISANILRLNLYNQTEVVFDVNSLPMHWSDSLQLIFTRGKVEDIVPRKIDMRFSNPIIVY